MQIDYEHWFEILLAGLVALGGWLFRLGKKYSDHENKLKEIRGETERLSEDVEKEIAKRSIRDADMFTRLENLKVEQAKQGEQIVGIRDDCAEIKQDFKQFLFNVVPGGNRHTDPPART